MLRNILDLENNLSVTDVNKRRKLKESQTARRKPHEKSKLC